ncbi:aminotransferase class V-fold PLP-dependent enzyme [Halarcobacter bivalviorum]|uniref:Aminotransferase n=1 Tax=Halarcobacter bivalviorum TaxID=663364 RepID=A0AAX2A869_9BACT|nr:aminotransferase class V-fold PLP-dependent enzyme [Halarcobacter bivalviorum]AXH13578.1 cysteine sulfinate desulfinase [Halarcobacter bivalviorum]RXK09817.1 aminotransferase [Halarcobacter bivalviorum]
MKKDIYRPFFDKNTQTLDFIRYNTIGKSKNEYFDYTASGLAFRQIENRIRDVLETYANTHSKESLNANITNQYYLEAIDSLCSSLELNEEFTVIPTGCGATAAIKKFQELIGVYIPPATLKRFGISVAKKKLPLIIVGPYEHHSNEVSYREALCEVQRIRLTDEGLVDLRQLKEVLQENRHREIIGCFCIASNVTGIITPYEEISRLLRLYGATVCFDAAASSPYMNIPCELYDALVMSPHKLLGGPASCGILAIRKSLVDNSLAPTFAGGGTVAYVNAQVQEYEKDISARETAGTPGIIQLIRAALAYQLRNEIGFEFIKKQKEELLKHLLKGLDEIEDITIYGNKTAANIGIISFNIANLNPYKICEKLSSNSGIQTRAGCSCAGPYGHDLLGKTSKEELEEKPGWLRISIHYSQTKEEIDRLLEAIKESIK